MAPKILKSAKTPPTQKRKQRSELARRRLRGAFEDDDTSSANDFNNTTEDELLPPLQKHQFLQSPRSSRHDSLSPKKALTPSKRLKRLQEQHAQKIQAESFIMKLFDRSLDLSMYTQQTALYPICRAWMANQPRNAGIRSYRDLASPTPVKREDNAAALMTRLHRNIIDVNAMPAPDELEFEEPTPPPPPDGAAIAKASAREDGDLEGATKAQLLHAHMQRWKKAKRNAQKMTHRRCHQRYDINRHIIKMLYKPKAPSAPEQYNGRVN